jgi:hypothetical protein
LTKILLTNAHRKHLTTLPHTRHTNAASVVVNLLLVLGKSATFAKNQNVKSVINAANLTAAANTVNLKDIVRRNPSRNPSPNASQIVSANAKRNAASVENLKRLLQTIVENALSSKYVLANN